MELKLQKRLAAQILKCSKYRVWLDPNRLDEIKEAITKVDIRGLIYDNAIKREGIKGISRGRVRKNIRQKRKGRRKGFGSRKGKRTARLPRKTAWITRIRAQRNLLKELRERKIITKRDYQNLYMLAKGGFFRSRRHIRLYIEERGIKK